MASEQKVMTKDPPSSLFSDALLVPDAWHCVAGRLMLNHGL